MKKLKANKGLVNFFKSFGIKKAFLTDDIRFDRNGAHHTGVDVVLNDGTCFGVFDNGEILN